jgi:predicted O-methyltransferase YrrM
LVVRYSAKERAALAVSLVLVVVTIATIWAGATEVGVTSLTLVGLIVVLLLLDGRQHERDHFRRLAASARDKAREDRMRFEELGAGFRMTSGRVRDLDTHVREQLSRATSAASRDGENTRALVRSRTQELQRLLDGLGVGVAREVAATAEARERVGRHDVPLPPLGGWAMDPSGLVRVLHLVASRRPGLVVECGSGASTVWLAYAVRDVGGRIVSLEHDETHLEATTALLEEHHLTDVAEVRLAPLTDIRDGDATQPWYDVGAVEDLKGIDLLVVDGPPGDTSEEARYPAVPLLRDRLADRAVIALDDATRPDEARIVQRWLEEDPRLVRRHVGASGLAVLDTRALPSSEEADAT